MPLAAAANLLLLVAGVYLPGLTGLLRTTPLALGEFAAAGAVPALLVLLGRHLRVRVG
ncbi:hypothetical protein [Blastococcus sp. VKM Ac-2987]|uniref:hypothetical protein n=1 Tax=Blastococcus sp. VKM Ac-2987 TaxID=3004141 RepID=UPI0022AB858B|nr:hypothetical protein [Blastococcus sp. VKM Ac-2987]MCZ2860590.1 hypothetical protein [Blastococcus sp. VKM Ac-2987]